MAEIKMNTDTARSTSSTIQSSHDQIQSALSSLKSSMDALQQSWIAAGATQFAGDYSQWQTSMNNAMQALMALRSRLDREIAEYEQVAAQS